MSYKTELLFSCSVVAIFLAFTSAIRVDQYNSGGLGVIYAGYEEPAPAPIRVLVKKPLRSHEKEQQQDFSKIPGVPGHDYPIYHSVPHTSFSCANVPFAPGMYANVETGCQAYHVCHDGREGKQGASFLCTNGTLFNQKEFACDWWYNVNCKEATHYYDLNLDPLKNPYFPKPKPEEQIQEHQIQVPAHQQYQSQGQHGHVARVPTYIHVV